MSLQTGDEEYQTFLRLVQNISSFLKTQDKQINKNTPVVYEEIKKYRKKFVFTFDYIMKHIYDPEQSKIVVLQLKKKESFFDRIFHDSNSQFQGTQQKSKTFQYIKQIHRQIEQLKKKDINSRKSEWIQIANKLMYISNSKWNQQIIVNIMKKQLTNTLKQNQIPLCCKVFYQLDSKIQQTQTEYNEFKRYRWPIQNQSLLFHIKKTLIGFLNRGGGIIYMGLFQNQQKLTQIEGMILQSHQKQKLIQLIYKIAQNIYPKLSNEDEQKQKQKFEQQLKIQRQSAKTSLYFISKYISIDFNPLVNINTYMNAKDVGNSIKYIVRVLIHPGEKDQLYHIINEQTKLPEAFVRQDKSIKKKKIQQFLQTYYKKQQQFELNGGGSKDKHFLTPSCRFRDKLNDLTLIKSFKQNQKK